jgi:hypothetical protein
MALELVTELPDGNWLGIQRLANNTYGYQVNARGDLSSSGLAALYGYNVTGGWLGKPFDFYLGYNPKGGDIIYITLTSGKKVSYDPNTGKFSEIIKDGTTGTVTTTPLVNTFSKISDFLPYINFGSNDYKIRAFFKDQDNDKFIQNAMNDLNYTIPDNNNNPNQSSLALRQIYWGAYYCSKYPITNEGLLPLDCDVILQTIQSLKDDYATVQQQISTNTANQFFGIDTQVDYNLQLQAITDLSIVYNGLASKSACTKAAAGGGSKLITYAIIGFVIIVIVVVVKKSKNKSN